MNVNENGTPAYAEVSRPSKGNTKLISTEKVQELVTFGTIKRLFRDKTGAYISDSNSVKEAKTFGTMINKE